MLASNFAPGDARLRIRIHRAGVPVDTELFRLLMELFPVTFAYDEGREIEVMEGNRLQVELDSDASACLGIAPKLTIPALSESTSDSRRVAFDVTFEDAPDVPKPFRGRIVRTSVPASWNSLSLRSNERVIASGRAGPIWTVSQTGGVKHFRSALPLPRISTTAGFSDVFNGGRFLEMLPLLQFLRTANSRSEFQPPPMRAGFIVDDPNLHWPRYGFVDYRLVAARASARNYHVAFATIPLDTWYTHAATADVFRRNSRWLSLLVHGNNHAKHELAGDYSDARRTALLAQAIQRIERFERKSDLQVCRVMVPPHGACTEQMFSELPRWGFEAACISTGSVRAYNPDKTWTRSLGYFPSEMIRGCPVLPRWGLTENVENNLLVAAFLGQAMILRGHHRDFRHGTEVLDELADRINALGDVRWSNLKGLGRSSYLWRVENTSCRVIPLGNVVAFQPPAEATEMVVEPFNALDHRGWMAVSPNGSPQQVVLGEPFPLKDRSGILLRHIATLPRPPPGLPGTRRTRPALVLRRLLTEARDRLLVS